MQGQSISYIPSNLTCSEIEKLFENTPYRDILEQYTRKLRSEIEDEQKESPEIQKLIKERDCIDEQLYFARELVRELKSMFEHTFPKYKETKTLIADIISAIEDSNLEY